VARLRTESKHDLQRVVTVLIRFIARIALPCSVLLALNADALLSLVFGADLASYGPDLTILAIAIPLSFAYVLVERLAYAADDQTRALIIRAIGAVVSLVILFLTVRPMGHMGAATALVSAEIVMFILFLPRWSVYAPGVSVWQASSPGVLFSAVALGIALAVCPRGGATTSAIFAGCLLGVALFRERRSSREHRSDMTAAT